MRQHWRLVRSGACTAPWNMAVDEAMYRLSAREVVPPTLRLFRWSPPAVSIGRFQEIGVSEIQTYLEHGYPLVRRPTGGLAVLHENDLSYAIVARVGGGGLSTTSRRGLYRQAHEALMDALGALGVRLDLYSGIEERTSAGLCCAVPMHSDLILHGGQKIGGSAQIRGAHTVLQHGCVHAPTTLGSTRFEKEVSKAFERTMGLHLLESDLSPQEVELALYLIEHKYGRNEWNIDGRESPEVARSNA